MSFYGIAGLFISSYLWCTISWNVGSGYDRFDRKDGIVCIFRWGFPGKNRRVFLQFLIKDIQSVRIEVKEGIYARRVLYMDIKGQGAIPLTRTDENFTPREMEQKAAELAYFLPSGIVSKILRKEKGGYEITIADASDGRQVVDIIPPGPELLVSEGESIKLDQPLISNPNVGEFGQGDAEIVHQDPLRVQGLLFFFAFVILAQIFLVLKKKQFEKVQLSEMNF
nr:photosystem I assembly protein Ycf4, chloroplastic [Tanacetum cinerariifolium]